MIFLKKWFIFAVLNIKFGYSLYFTMTNMEGTLPILSGKQQHEPIISFYAVGNNFTYSVKNINNLTSDLVSIGKRTGDLFLTSTDVSSVSLEIFVQDSLNAKTATYLKLTTTPIGPTQNTKSLFNCNDNILKGICFWSKVTYQFEMTNTSTYLGPLAPRIDMSTCSIQNISYFILTGTNFLKLHPPNNKTKSWILGTKEDFMEKVHNLKLFSNITCKLEISNKTREFSKLIEIRVLDNEFSIPNPQEENFKISFAGWKINKGDVISKDILFLDKPLSNGYNYQPFIDDQHVSEFLQPNCTYQIYSHQGKNGTVIYCELKVTKARKFKNDLTFLLGLRKTRVDNHKKNNTVYVNITLTFGNTYTKRSSSFFKNANKIFRTAAPYARVTQPDNHRKNMTHYSVKVINSNRNPFRITTEGIIYVYDFLALRNCSENLRLNITWSESNITQYEEVEVRVVDEPTKTCLSMLDFYAWEHCAQFENQKSCLRKDSCALGTGGTTSVETRTRAQRCMWRGDKHPENHETNLYSTCSADKRYCPDGVCDSLELLDEDKICPQDCSVGKISFPTKLNSVTGRGVDKCNGVLVCNTLGCSCEIKDMKKIDKSFVAQTQENKLVVDKKCGLKCILATGSGVIVFVGGIFFILIFWRIKYVKKITKAKYIQNTPEAETSFSEYIERNITNEPLVLNFHMTSNIDTVNSDFNSLKTNEVDLKWEFPRNQICIEQILGEGEFGKVLKAKAFNIGGRPGYSLVAVKTLKDDARKQDYNDLYSEYQLLKEVCHPHVVQLLGVCSSDDGPLYVIIEYAKFGSLRNYLRRSRHILNNIELGNIEENQIHKVTPRDILSFARQISNGMSYLSDIKLVHRDLAARNILLAENKICKISDFGLTRDIYEDNAYFKKSKGRVPVKWMAPESLADHIYTTKSDVWSFGILIWELITLGASPYPGIPVHNLYHLLKEGYRMEKPPNCSTVLYSLMSRCWNIDPEERPSFLELYHHFDNLLTDNMNYLDLSDNAILNKSYFAFEPETDIPNSANINLLENYPNNKEMPRNKDEPINFRKEHKEINNCLGYETPVKSPKRIKTPTNEMPEEYTDMNFKEEI